MVGWRGGARAEARAEPTRMPLRWQLEGGVAVSLQVVSLANISCSFGTAPTALSVIPAAMVNAGGLPAASTMDYAPLVNVLTFGMCSSLMNPTVASATAAALGALARLTDPNGMRLGSRHITISTVGVVPGIKRLPDANDQVRLAVSFHAADDELRNELVPANRLWPLGELVEAIAGWRERTHHRPSIEWAMIDGVNDADEQAAKLAPIAYGLRAHVNLIPLNPTAGSPTRPSPQPARPARVVTPASPPIRPARLKPRKASRPAGLTTQADLKLRTPPASVTVGVGPV